MRTSMDGRLLGTSSDDDSIKIWDAASLREIAQLRPGFSGGRERFALDRTHSRIFSGTWEDGLNCYDFAGERLCWRREDLIGVQGVAFSPAFPSSVFVVLEAPDQLVDGPDVFTGVVELDAATGDTEWQTEDADSIYLHPERAVYALTSRETKRVRIFDGASRLLGSTPMANFAIMDAAFQGDRLALAEGAKGVRLTNLTGDVLFSYRPASRICNCIQIAFSGDSNAVNVFDRGKKTNITSMDTGGRVVCEYARSTPADICFVGDGTRFVDALGNVCRSSDGQVEARILA